MIIVDRLTKRYGAATAVDDVTFTAAPGRVTGFLGPNGAGFDAGQWAQLGATSAVWLVLPLAVGVVTLLRSEVK